MVTSTLAKDLNWYAILTMGSVLSTVAAKI